MNFIPEMKSLASLIALIAVVPAFATPVDIDKRNSSAIAVTHTGQVRNHGAKQTVSFTKHTVL